MVALSGGGIGLTSLTRCRSSNGPCVVGAKNAFCVVQVRERSCGTIGAAAGSVRKWVCAKGTSGAEIRVQRASHQKLIGFRGVFQNILADIDKKSWTTIETCHQLNITANKMILRTFGPNRHGLCLHCLTRPPGDANKKWRHFWIIQAVSVK